MSRWHGLLPVPELADRLLPLGGHAVWHDDGRSFRAWRIALHSAETGGAARVAPRRVRRTFRLRKFATSITLRSARLLSRRAPMADDEASNNGSGEKSGHTAAAGERTASPERQRERVRLARASPKWAPHHLRLDEPRLSERCRRPCPLLPCGARPRRHRARAISCPPHRVPRPRLRRSAWRRPRRRRSPVVAPPRPSRDPSPRGVDAVAPLSPSHHSSRRSARRGASRAARRARAGARRNSRRVRVRAAALKSERQSLRDERSRSSAPGSRRSKARCERKRRSGASSRSSTRRRPRGSASASPSSRSARLTARICAGDSRSWRRRPPRSPSSRRCSPSATCASLTLEGKLAAAPQAGGADDLKVLRGIGPKFEKALKAAGVTTLAQIAAWTERRHYPRGRKLNVSAERIRRDDWVGRAQKLAGR